MPRTTSQADAPASKKKAVARKSSPKKSSTKKRIKSVLIDVIEDELMPSKVLPKQAFSQSQVVSERKKFLAQAAASQSSGDIDQQKKFYSEFVSQLKEKKSAQQGGVQNANLDAQKTRHPLSLYRRLAIKFIILVIFLSGVVFYFSFSKLTVSLSLKGETLNNNLLLKVAGQPAAASSSAAGLSSIATSAPLLDDSLDPRNEVSGQIRVIKSSVSQDYPATGETYIGDEIVGRVRIINNYSRSQALVATTRLLTPDNKLFRIKEAVTVPAGGEVEVEIYADSPSASLAIGPTNFTIPGLWVGLQDQIYAKNNEAFVYTTKVRKHVNASDLELAARDINERLMQAVRTEAERELGDSWLYQAIESPLVSIDAKIGDQVEKFSAKAEASFVAVSFNKEQIAQLAQAKLNLLIPAEKELAEFRPENISYSLENYDAENNLATIKAGFSAAMILKQDARFIDSRQLVNLTADQIGTYLRDKPEIKEYELHFSPSFIKKAPGLADRIKIEINKN